MRCLCRKSCMRLYRVNEDGSEHIVLFALDGSFMTDLFSFLTNEASSYNIDTIEDSELVLITRSASDELRKISPKYKEFIFQKTSDAYTQLEKRITAKLVWMNLIKSLQHSIPVSFNGCLNT